MILKSLDKRRRIGLSITSIGLALFIIFSVSKEPITKVSLDTTIPVVKSIKTSTSASLESQFKNVERHEVPNAQATVIFVPQIHKEPTTQASDAKNDQALIVQKEIFSMLNDLINKHDAKFVMDETDLYGPMPSSKIQKIQQGIAAENKYRQDMDQLLRDFVKNGGSQSQADEIKAQSEKKLAEFERNIYLTGGAAVLAATNNNASVYGSQNAATINEARKQLQNIVYMESRISELEGKTQSSNQASSVSTGNGNSELDQILSMLNQSGSSSSNVFAPIIKMAKSGGNTSLLASVQACQKSLNDLMSRTNFEAFSESSAAPSADIQTNPYQNVRNLSNLKDQYNVAYDKFMKLAKDQRSQEVSDNVVKMIKENNQKTGVLVLGAQHKDQLIEDLNKQGVNVIVVTPQSELNMNS